MPSPNSPTPSPTKAPLPPLLIQGLISLTTGPLLVALVGGKILADAAQDLGQLSEELFRGDRLPLLKTPVSQPSAPDPHPNQP